MLGQEIAAALPELRAHAASLMVDACIVTRGGGVIWDDAAGGYIPDPNDPPTTVYEGKCRLRNAAPAPQNADAGETTWAVDLVVVSLPVVGSEGVADGDTVTVTASSFDAAAVGAVLTVQSAHVQTHSTARRLSCQVVSRDG